MQHEILTPNQLLLLGDCSCFGFGYEDNKEEEAFHTSCCVYIFIIFDRPGKNPEQFRGNELSIFKDDDQLSAFYSWARISPTSAGGGGCIMRPGSRNSATQGRIPGRNYFVARVAGDASKQGRRRGLGYIVRERGAGERESQGRGTVLATTFCGRGTRCVRAALRKELWCQEAGRERVCPWLGSVPQLRGRECVSPEGSEQVGQGGEGCLPGAGSCELGPDTGNV